MRIAYRKGFNYRCSTIYGELLPIEATFAGWKLRRHFKDSLFLFVLRTRSPRLQHSAPQQYVQQTCSDPHGSEVGVASANVFGERYRSEAYASGCFSVGIRSRTRLTNSCIRRMSAGSTAGTGVPLSNSAMNAAMGSSAIRHNGRSNSGYEYRPDSARCYDAGLGRACRVDTRNSATPRIAAKP